jgi:hypothetical protein
MRERVPILTPRYTRDGVIDFSTLASYQCTHIGGFFNFSLSVTIFTHSIPRHASYLKCSYGALYQVLNKRSVSDLSAFAGQEIRKDVAVLASRHSFGKGFLKEKGRDLTCSSSYREPQVAQPEALCIVAPSLVLLSSSSHV